MKIIPTHSILIGGQHCEAGRPIEVARAIAGQLITERQATRAAGEVETAAVAPVVETAAAKSPRKPRA